MFIESAESRQTSPELMAAILAVAGGDEWQAEMILEHGPTSAELVAIVEIVTRNGMYETTGFYWGGCGEHWASESAA